jgi:hypothetical protein
MNDDCYIEILARRIRASIPSSRLPDDNTNALFRIYAVLAIAKDGRVKSEDVHNAWVAWMLGIEPKHDALIPFDELPPEVKKQDEPYVKAICQAYSSLR